MIRKSARHSRFAHFSSWGSILLLLLLAADCCKADNPHLAITPQTATIYARETIQLTAAAPAGTHVYWLATAGTIDDSGKYTAPMVSEKEEVVITASTNNDQGKSQGATLLVMPLGQVSKTANPQVALYSIAPASAGSVSVEFGEDTRYGRTTWSQPLVPGQMPVNIFVAGMRANTLYHIRGVLQMADGTQILDDDQTFMTGSMPSDLFPTISAGATPGMTPQGGVELLDPVDESPSIPPVVMVTDLDGNTIWAYGPNLPPRFVANPTKLLPNGHFLVNFDVIGTSVVPDGEDSVLQEVDLTGNLIWQMTAADLNTALAKATCAGCAITVIGTHHDFAILSNGHLIVIAATQENIAGTTVTGDVIIDLDQNRNPVWLWNEFDHLDVNRQPMGFPDWTHTNAVLYSPDDGDLIISVRHQNWLIKIDYANGTGAGDIVWKLGYQGDFALLGGTDPTDWFYAQHGPSFVTRNTTGLFSMILDDNGDDRVFPSNVTCGTAGEPPCLYSTVPLLEIDEKAKIATLAFHTTMPEYSFFGGNAAVLNNGDAEYCQSSSGSVVTFNGAIYEVKNSSAPQTVWQMQVGGQYIYRGQRIPSLYPGVQW